MPTIEQYYMCPVYVLYWVHTKSKYNLRQWANLAGYSLHNNNGPMEEARVMVEKYGQVSRFGDNAKNSAADL